MYRSIEARIQKLEIARRPFELRADLSHLTDRELHDIACGGDGAPFTANAMRPYISRRTTDDDRVEWAKGPNRVRDWGSVQVAPQTQNVPRGTNAVYLKCSGCYLQGFLFDTSLTHFEDVDALVRLRPGNDAYGSPTHKQFDFYAYELINRGELDFVAYADGETYEENFTDGLRLF